MLYVDEVNLLHDHLVDLLLDAAALGTSYVEREGVSVRHAARFLLVGTMNPEEGELRPQLLDRFGLTVEVAATREPVERAEVVRRRLAYEADPAGFAAAWAAADAELAARIAAARARLPRVVLGDRALREVTTVCAAFDVDGLRADLVTAKAAVALAAWAGRDEVTTEDVRTAARLALPHRRRRTPFEAPGLDEQQLDDALDSVAARRPARAGRRPPDGRAAPAAGRRAGRRRAPSRRTAEPRARAGPGARDRDQAAAQEPASRAPGAAPGERRRDAGRRRSRPWRCAVPGVNRRAGAAGRRSRSRGRQRPADRRAAPDRAAASLHLTATLRAAAPHQLARGRSRRGPACVRRDDLREAVREGREGNLVLFVVDASGSMAARSRMGAVKGAVLSLLTDAYQRRDKVALVTFRGAGAELALPPTGSVEAAVARLAELPTGGRTPLSAGLLRAAEVLRVEAVRDRARRALVVVVTDGRHTSGPAPELAAAHLAAHRRGLRRRRLRERAGAARARRRARRAARRRRLRLEELSADAPDRASSKAA